MKRLFFILTMSCALCAAALFAADRAFCKYCGSSSFGNLQQMLTSSCSKSPTGKHQPYQGAPRRFYLCSYCATESASFAQLVLSPCSKSPRKYHDAYEGTEKTFYICKECGFESHSFKQLVTSLCSKSPRKYHNPL
ncbi:hypothetical protein AGMMS4952_26460 [Spirochaetia bacterium]|nr:hypothetical protein AGMMS4952_26460 [Spirochaetia bacterium]